MFYKIPPAISDLRTPPLYKQLKTIHRRWSDHDGEAYTFIDAHYFNDGKCEHSIARFIQCGEECSVPYTHVFKDGTHEIKPGKVQPISRSVMVAGRKSGVVASCNLEELVIDVIEHESIWLIGHIPSFGNLWTDSDNEYGEFMSRLDHMCGVISELGDDLAAINSLIVHSTKEVGDGISLESIIKFAS
jgi:hypothetical protein